jgi:hypothetical protein
MTHDQETVRRREILVMSTARQAMDKLHPERTVQLGPTTFAVVFADHLCIWVEVFAEDLPTPDLIAK